MPSAPSFHHQHQYQDFVYADWGIVCTRLRYLHVGRGRYKQVVPLTNEARLSRASYLILRSND